MLISDWRKYKRQVSFSWELGMPEELDPLEYYLDEGERAEFIHAFRDDEDIEEEN